MRPIFYFKYNNYKEMSQCIYINQENQYAYSKNITFLNL